MAGKPPRFDYSPPTQPDRFVYFERSPNPVFGQEYGTSQEDPLTRYVDIGDEHFALIEHEIKGLVDISGITIGQPVAGSAQMLEEAQGIRFGHPRRKAGKGGKDVSTGRLMVEPETLYDAIQRLNHIGKLRLSKSEHLEYKWFQPIARHAVAHRKTY